MGISAKAQFKPRNSAGQFVNGSVAQAVRASVVEACDMIEGLAKGYAPVDTGRLRDSIATTIDDTGKTVVGTVGTDVDYAVYQEFGTIYQRGTPFMRPALDEARPAIKELFRDTIATSIKT